MEAFIGWELDGSIFLWNQGVERLYGFTQEEAIGRVAHELLGTRHADGVGGTLGELEETGARRIVLEANRDVTELKALEPGVSKARPGETRASGRPRDTLAPVARTTRGRLQPTGQLGAGDSARRVPFGAGATPPGGCSATDGSWRVMSPPRPTVRHVVRRTPDSARKTGGRRAGPPSQLPPGGTRRRCGRCWRPDSRQQAIGGLGVVARRLTVA